MQRLLNDTDTVAVIHIDRMRVGDHNGIPLQGGMFYPAIKENLAKRVLWAFNSDGVARAVANRAAQNGGYVKLALMQEGNVIGNKTFTHAWFKELRDNVAAGKITEKKALREMNEVRKRWKADKEMPTGHNRDWKSLDEAQQAFLDMTQTKRGRTYFQKTVRVTKSEGEKIAYGSLLAQQMTGMGFPDAIRLVDALEDRRFKGVPPGATVGILRFDPVPEGAKIGTAADYGVPEHLSYGYVLTGDIVAKMPFYNVVDQKFPHLKNRLLSQAHTDFPAREIIPQTPEVAAGSINFMPDQPASPAQVVLDELKRSNFISTKLAQSTLGSFPEYLRPVAQFITDQREKLVTGTMTPRDVTKAYMMTIASQGAGAVGVKTLADKLAKVGVTFDPPEMFRTKEGDKIRPEEAAAYWLGTPEGRKALDNADSGVYNPADWKGLVEVRKAFGDDRFATFRVMEPGNLANITKVVEKLNASKGDADKVITAVQELKGIGTGKKGFISHLLGIGNVPTIDAVELNFWITGKGDITQLDNKKATLARKVKDVFSDKRVGHEIFRRIDDRIAQLRDVLPGAMSISPDVWAHVMHHWLWDKAKGIETTHAGLYEAQRNFMPEAPAQAISSADTSLQQVPALFKSSTFVPRGKNLDIGAGKYDLGKQYLERERGVTESVPFDPFNRDADTNRSAVERLQSGERFSTTTIPNVLNVIAERSARDNVILQAARALQPEGVAYFQIYEGDRSGSGRETSKGYQNNKKTSDYLDEVRQHFREVRTSGNVIVASDPKITQRKAFWQLAPEGPSMRFMPEALSQISSDLERAGIKNDISESNGVIRLHRMVVPPDQRNRGIGTSAMQQLVAYADQAGKRIALSPSTDFGGSSVSRLKDFYRRFGFVDNKGSGRDLSVSETMIREPKLQVNFQPEAMPNGTVYRSNVGFNVVNKAGGKYRVYSPVGILVGVANSLEESQRMIERKVK